MPVILKSKGPVLFVQYNEFCSKIGIVWVWALGENNHSEISGHFVTQWNMDISKLIGTVEIHSLYSCSTV